MLDVRRPELEKALPVANEEEMLEAHPMIDIRPATVRDVPAIATLLVDTWRSTFTGILPDDFLSGMSQAKQEERHRRNMDRSDTAYFVAESGNEGRIVGFADCGPSRTAELAHSGELYAIYILSEFQRRGLGDRLVRAAASALWRQGHRSMFAWVLTINPNSRFYEILGGRAIARQPVTLGSTTVDEIAYGWDDISALIKS
jgi:ribosomal protein S18 acetylase RimI-like enzyme